MDDIKVKVLAGDVGGACCYFLQKDGAAVCIDPSVSVEEMQWALGGELPRVCAILLTHGHFDHILCLSQWIRLTGAPLMIGKGDGAFLQDASLNCFLQFFGESPVFPPPDRLLEAGRIADLPMEVEVIPTPGHTPGSCCFRIGGALYTGDTLFAGGGVGRTDLPGGDFAALKDSLSRLLSLPDMPVYPGHGSASTLAKERRHHLFEL